MYSKFDYYRDLVSINDLLRSNADLISRKYTKLFILPGWIPGLTKIFNAIKESGLSGVVIQQISERNGLFELYYFGGDEALHKNISAIERSIAKSCDICGEPSSRVKVSGEMRNRCSDHSTVLLTDYEQDATVKKYKAEFVKLKKLFIFDPD